MLEPSTGGSSASQSSIVFGPTGCASAALTGISSSARLTTTLPRSPDNPPTCIFISLCRQVDSIVTNRPIAGGRAGPRGGTIKGRAAVREGRVMTDNSTQIRVDAGRLWAGAAATALVAGLIAVVGILIARGIVHVDVLA